MRTVALRLLLMCVSLLVIQPTRLVHRYYHLRAFHVHFLGNPRVACDPVSSCRADISWPLAKRHVRSEGVSGPCGSETRKIKGEVWCFSCNTIQHDKTSSNHKHKHKHKYKHKHKQNTTQHDAPQRNPTQHNTTQHNATECTTTHVYVPVLLCCLQGGLEEGVGRFFTRALALLT